jgi:nitrite reductase/ring-hydroxylating ferredoxin subunit
MTQDTATIEFVAAAKVSDLSEGDVMKVQIGELKIALFNVDGSFYATEEICTHAHASLAEGYVDGDAVECPLHGACFSIKTGKALTAPATFDLATYPISVVDGDVLIGIPR